MKRILKSILKYPIMILNRMYIWTYYKKNDRNTYVTELNLDEHDNIIVFSPHVDDETIGLGGTIIRYGKLGKRMILVYLTDGSGSTSYKPKEQLIIERKEEGIIVKEKYGFKDVYFLDKKDGNLDSNDENLIEELKNIFQTEKTDIIFTPFLIDGNNDHLETTHTISKVLNLMDLSPQIYLYEVNNLISKKIVNTISVLDSQIYAEKKEKFNIFKSQWAMGFSIYDAICRGKSLYYKKGYAVEHFVKVSINDLKDGIELLKEHQFKAGDFKQISSEFTLMPAIVKGKNNKERYNKLLKELWENNDRRSSLRAEKI